MNIHKISGDGRVRKIEYGCIDEIANKLQLFHICALRRHKQSKQASLLARSRLWHREQSKPASVVHTTALHYSCGNWFRSRYLRFCYFLARNLWLLLFLVFYANRCETFKAGIKNKVDVLRRDDWCGQSQFNIEHKYQRTVLLMHNVSNEFGIVSSNIVDRETQRIFFFFCFRDNVVSTGVCGWWNAVCISRHKWSLREIKFGIISTINTRIYRTPTTKYECGPTTYVKRIILLVSPSHLGQLDFNDRLRAHASHTHIRNK